MSWTPQALEALGRRLITGHPALVLEPEPQAPEPHWRPWGVAWKSPKPQPLMIYLCANCERMRTVLFLTEDRWLCTACKNEGDARPTLVPINYSS